MQRTTQTNYQDKRLPAYCDRILWRSASYLQVECDDYWCGSEVSTSDHKPVAALLHLTFRPMRPQWWPVHSERYAQSVKRTGVMPSLHHLAAHHHFASEIPAFMRAYRFQILSLKATNLAAGDTNGLSDPYCVFQGDAVLRSECTPIEWMTLNPSWPKATLPSFTVVELSEDGSALEFERYFVFLVGVCMKRESDSLATTQGMDFCSGLRCDFV